MINIYVQGLPNPIGWQNTLLTIFTDQINRVRGVWLSWTFLLATAPTVSRGPQFIATSSLVGGVSLADSRSTDHDLKYRSERGKIGRYNDEA